MKLKNIIAFLFFICVFISFLSPIYDVDFPWHLKTGEYIYQHKEIPKTDPFSMVSTGDARERFILSCYWLGQLIFYGIFSLAGPLGIIVLRGMLLTGSIIILWFFMKHTPILLKIGILYITTVLFLSYTGDRPQLFSFFFGVAVIAIMEHYRRTLSPKFLLFLPLLMWFWANIHGGYIFGIVVIAIVCFFETIKYFCLGKKTVTLTREKLLLLLVLGLLSILAAYLNPNTYQAVTQTVESQGDPLFHAVKEYQSPLQETWGPFANKNNFIYWSLVGYSLVLLALNLRRLDLTHAGLIFFTLFISLSAIRFVPFFVMAALLISGQYKFNIIDFERFPWINKLKFTVTVVTFFVVLLWGGSVVHSMRPLGALKNIPETRFFPKRAAHFLLQNLEGGRIFCSYNTGSYLLSQLYPRFRMFVDTRGINYKAVNESVDISYTVRWAYDNYSFFDALQAILPNKGYGDAEKRFGKRPHNPPKNERWSDLLDLYNIDIIVHEATNSFTGEIYPLALRMVRDERWKLVYSDGNVMIFVRDVPKFSKLISKYGLDKKRIYDQIGIENAPKLGGPFPTVYSSIAFALLMKGGSDKAIEENLGHALYLEPGDFMGHYLETFLKSKRQKG